MEGILDCLSVFIIKQLISISRILLFLNTLNLKNSFRDS